MNNVMTDQLMEATVGGLVAGYAVAVPVGALAVLLVSLTARTSFRVGAAGAIGVATADGAYAAVAVLGGAAVAGAVEPVAGPLRWTAAGVLALMAARSARTALRSLRASRTTPDTANTPEARGTSDARNTSEPRSASAPPATAEPPDAAGPPGARGAPAPSSAPKPVRDPVALGTPARAYFGLLGLTLLNPWAIIYFSALTLGQQHLGGAGPLSRTVFVAAIIFASLSWQLLLASGGLALGRALTGVRGRAVTGLVSGAVIGGLAVGLAVWG